MPKQNRVTPSGDIIATSERGTLMGNRGILHNGQKEIIRPYAHKSWIICLLSFKDYHSEIMAPGHYTQLFFLDEATALAAGHRPCFECQRERAKLFRETWVAANPDLVNGRSVKVSEIDAVLHNERLTQAYRVKDRRKRTFTADLAVLPKGVFVMWGERPCLLWANSIFPWTPAGYEKPLTRPDGGLVTVLTPRSTVKMLACGFVPTVHETAVGLR